MSRYQARTGSLGSATTCELIDTEAKVQAVVVPSVGSNMIALRYGEESARILYEPETLEDLKKDPTGYGYPILMPPNRIWSAQFELDGILYKFPVNREDYHIHGLVHNLEWDVLEHTCSEDDGAILETVINSATQPAVQAVYPQHFRLTMRFVLKDGMVTISTQCVNLSDTALPFGVGFHPYFCTPMTPQSTKETCYARLAADEQWELKNCFPTGRRYEPSADYDLRQFRSVSTLRLDDLYGCVRDSKAVLEDRGSGLRLEVEADEAYPYWVIWTGRTPAAPYICFEPYSCVTNAPNLDMPRSETGLRVLARGETFSGTVTVSVSRISDQG